MFRTLPLRILCAAALALAPTLLPGAATAQGRACAPRAAVMAALSGTWGETRRGIGLAGDAAAVVELFASDTTGSWTVTITTPAGLTCLIAAGTGWEARSDDLPAEGSPT